MKDVIDAGGLLSTPAPINGLSTQTVEAKPLTASPVPQPTGNFWDQRYIYWVAGIIEGEGCIFHNKYTTKKGEYRQYPSIVVEMCDRDVLDRIHSITGFGTVMSATRPSRPAHWTDTFTLRITRKSNVARLLLAIYPLMSQRKQEQIRNEVLSSW